MKHYLVTAFLFFWLIPAFSQSHSSQFTRENSVQLEAGGHGLFYSLNYERILLNSNRIKWTVQSGMAYYPPKFGIIQFWIPITTNVLYSMNKHHIELGVGRTLTLESSVPKEVSTDFFWVARLGYRYQKPDGRLVFRASFAPIFESGSNRGKFSFSLAQIHPLPALAVGYCFGK
jgi:hypothetical protein